MNTHPLNSSREDRWIFIGDSITDAGRFRCSEEMGDGYVRLIRDWMLARDPSNAPQVINRGTSGHKVTDLQARWKTDILDAKPALVSIKIGINDVWHGLRPGMSGVDLKTFRSVYADLLRSLKTACPETRIVICEASGIWPPAIEGANAVLEPYIRATQELAEEFQVSALVPLYDAFRTARRQRPDIPWMPDGVHPLSSGHMLIARHWLTSTGLTR